MQKLTLDASSLRQRAMQCRHLADRMKDRQIAERLTLIASDYEILASDYVVPNKTPSKPVAIAERLKRVATRS
jgi:hypothetical protein